MVFTRYTLLISLFVLLYGGLVFHLYDLQLTQNQRYVALAESQYEAGRLLLADRGAIYFTDKNGKSVPAVTNKDFPLIYAVPKVIEDAAETANLIAPSLEVDPEDIQKVLGKPQDQYELLRKKAPRKMAEEVRALEAKGIYVDEVAERFYPFGTLAAHILGYVGPKSDGPGQMGRYGVEELYEETLAGVAGEMDGNRIVPPQPGEELVLTIDPNIQIESAQILERLIEQYNAKGGSVIVLDPKTGRILALESHPHFDPNTYSESDIQSFLNPATQKIYEPGSVVKVLTMAAGIDAGKITPDTTFNDPGILELNGRKIYNWDLKAHGTVTMTNVIELSLNTGAAFAQRKTGEKAFREYMANFGLGAKTGVDLPGEIKGDLRRLEAKDAPAIALATASFGQGIAVTPLEMVNAVAALANGGKLMRPYLNAALEPQEIRQVVSPETARTVAKMMVSAVDKAKVAKIKGYTIAGKTGTAQVPDLTKGGYSDKVINSYVGFGPTKDPRFVILMKLDEPEDAPLAGTTVVPGFRDLAQFILNYYNIPPDRIND